MTNSSNHWSIRMAEGERIAKKLAPLSTGIFVVGSVAYNPLAVREDSDLDVVAVMDDFAARDWEEAGEALGVKLNEDATFLASTGDVEVFRTLLDGRFKTNVYFRSEDAHRNFCRYFSGVNRFSEGDRVPDSCKLMSLKGETRFYDSYARARSGRIYEHHSVLVNSDGVWLGVPATNLLMGTKVLHGQDYLKFGFDDFNERLKAKALEFYGHGNSEVNLLNSFPKPLLDRMPAELKTKLERFLE